MSFRARPRPLPAGRLAYVRSGPRPARVSGGPTSTSGAYSTARDETVEKPRQFPTVETDGFSVFRRYLRTAVELSATDRHQDGILLGTGTVNNRPGRSGSENDRGAPTERNRNGRKILSATENKSVKNRLIFWKQRDPNSVVGSDSKTNRIDSRLRFQIHSFLNLRQKCRTCCPSVTKAVEHYTFFSVILFKVMRNIHDLCFISHF